MATLKKPLPRMASVDTLVKLAQAGFERRDWYDEEAAKLYHRARAVGVSFGRYVDVLAVTSPKVHVVKNGKITDAYLSEGSTYGMMKATRAALAHYENTGEIRGPKTSQFAAALKGNPTAIVLDLWMARAFGFEQEEFKRPAVRNECEKRVRAAGNRLGITPAQTQAAIWFGAVLAKGHDPKKKVF